jgi:signal transduction histidine kinase
LSNAFKYSIKGGNVEFTVSSDKEKLLFTVSDQGIGIPEDELPRIYETFQRAKNVADIQGSGLGLTIVKNAVELHGGSIEVKSKLGEGTTFVVTIPL